MDWITRVSSPLGPLILTGNEEALTGLWFAGQRHLPVFPAEMREAGDEPVIIRTQRWLEQYFSGEVPGNAPPLAPRGTAFQLRVWALLGEIPYGQTRTYGELARDLGCPSAQAVGGAVGRNPISLLLPCHRVLGAGGKLTGYAGGLWRKEALLRLEGILPPKERES